ncbi:arylamine N-acetyltransferase family protein [Pontibacter cellulosilyticus]|uniref:Arylamine N-acetyltransferase n=1 Tax=Pontibacter cellulosilyticus TaxID=1720253 RepID=A0A923N5J6_9BACT|nr:arylamine N-acetyltransferase [Pontibacter cellulosilyticus]MBC5991876.1 arylamine N-acetyltransferase [Pontibacter cellulosilyticus]
MNLLSYLHRIGFNQGLTVTEETLFALHKAHTLNVPFENLDVVGKTPIVLDQERFYRKIVDNGRGGICYELNGAFKQLLDGIGFESYFISCNVYVPHIGIYGADFGHIALITTIGEEQYLIDVGFGDAFIEPLKLQYGKAQNQYGTYYRLSQLPAGEVLLEKSEDDVLYQQMFKFALVPRQLEEFSALCEFHQHAPQAPFNKQALCTRPTIKGRITLTADKLVVREGKEKQETAVPTATAFDEFLAQHFNIRLQIAYTSLGESSIA